MSTAETTTTDDATGSELDNGTGPELDQTVELAPTVGLAPSNGGVPAFAGPDAKRRDRTVTTTQLAAGLVIGAVCLVAVLWYVPGIVRTDSESLPAPWSATGSPT